MEEEQRKDLAYVGINRAVEKTLRSSLAIIFTVKMMKVILMTFIIKKNRTFWREEGSLKEGIVGGGGVVGRGGVVEGRRDS